MADYLTPDARRRIAGGLMAAQHDRATPEEGNLMYANGGLGGSALNALLQSYGLGAPQPSPASPRYRPGDA